MGNETPNGGTLKEYRTLLLHTVTQQREDMSEVKTMLTEVTTKAIPALQVAVAKLQEKNRHNRKNKIYGFVGGFVPALGFLIYWWINLRFS